MGTNVPIFALPPVPHYGGYPLSQAKYFRRAKSEWSLAIPSGPTGALGLQKFRVYGIPRLRLALPSQRYRCRIRRRGDPCGRPQAFPLQGGRCPRRGRMRVTSWRLRQFPAGGPRASPTQTRKIHGKPVGRGLAPAAFGGISSRRGRRPGAPSHTRTGGRKGRPYGGKRAASQDTPIP